MRTTGPLILSIDAGTTSTRALLVSAQGEVVARAGRPLPLHTPQPGWVEQNGLEILARTLDAIRDVLTQVDGAAARVLGVGLTNQRETVLLWDRATGEPVAPAIVWQDRRTADVCARLRDAGQEPVVQAKTGLLLDPYFSATKIAWLLDAVPGARERAARGELLAGTVDSFLSWHLCGGAHITDATNASRTQLYDLAAGGWDASLCDLFQVPMTLLPRVTDSAGALAQVRLPDLGLDAPLAGIAGDQQAAAIGQGCLVRGMAKLTLGTGAFLLVHAGATAPQSAHRLLATVAWQLEGARAYALEGSLFVAGSAVQWLRDGLGLIAASDEIEALAESVPDSGGVQFVPAFTGLGAPYWDADARGLICGLTRGTTPAHIARACLEAMSQQTRDLADAFAADGLPLSRMRVDGGMSANGWLLQDMADTLELPVDRPAELDSTALGAAFLAMAGIGLVPDLAHAARGWQVDAQFTPRPRPQAQSQRRAWQTAIARARLADSQS
jgi:glycerol kinase